MRSTVIRLFCGTTASLLAGIAFAVPGSADLKENYQSIIERNPFGLKPPPEVKPPTNNVTQPPPKQKIFLTGITSIGYPRIPKYAYLKTEEEGKKEPSFYSLQEDQGKDGITVLQIDDKNKKVKIRTSEGERVLSFATDGIAPPATPGPLPGAQPGHPGVPIPGHPGGMVQPINTAAVPQPINHAYNGVNNAANSTPAGTYGAGTRIPSRNVRIRGTDGIAPAPVVNPVGGTSQNQEPPPIDPAVQYLMLKAQEQHNIEQGVPTPPIPPID